MNNPCLSIIIPVFNGLSYTKKCLKSLNELRDTAGVSEDRVQIVIVDDGSKDGTSDWVTKNYASAHLLYGDGNLWWSGGINKGVRYALYELKSDYILWWNNDILPHKDYLVELFNIIEKTPVNIIIGSKIFGLHQNHIWNMGGRFDSASGTFYLYGPNHNYKGSFQQPTEADWLPGMGTTIHHSVFRKIGFCDEKRFPQYHGDSDFTYRAKKAGFRLFAYPNLIIYNDTTNTGLIHGGSFKNLFKSLTIIKSNFNLKKDIAFYRKHATSLWAYIPLLNKYFRYIGGLIKWKVLNTIGIKKK